MVDWLSGIKTGTISSQILNFINSFSRVYAPLIDKIDLYCHKITIMFAQFSFFTIIVSRTSLIRTLKGQSEISVYERCPYWTGHCDDVTFKSPLAIDTELAILHFQLGIASLKWRSPLWTADAAHFAAIIQVIWNAWNCFMQLIQDELKHVVEHWNLKRIRPYRNSDSPAGRPDRTFYIFFLNTKKPWITLLQCQAMKSI